MVSLDPLPLRVRCVCVGGGRPASPSAWWRPVTPGSPWLADTSLISASASAWLPASFSVSYMDSAWIEAPP